MYDDQKAEWDKVWELGKSLKLGVTVKGVTAEIPGMLDKLKSAATSWQQFVAAYNAAKPDAREPLQQKVSAGAEAIQTQLGALKSALDKQISANKSAPLGQFQLPQDGPAATANPGLTALAGQLAAAGTALEIEMMGGDGSASDAPISLPVEEETLPPPDWLKTS